MKPKKYVVSLSGGKDSTAMLLMLIAMHLFLSYLNLCLDIELFGNRI